MSAEKGDHECRKGDEWVTMSAEKGAEKGDHECR